MSSKTRSPLDNDAFFEATDASHFMDAVRPS